jgi:hypothetical protein
MTTGILVILTTFHGLHLLGTTLDVIKSVTDISIQTQHSLRIIAQNVQILV